MAATEQEFASRVKGVVRKNFNQSADIYHAFEKKTRFFQNLTKVLARWMDIPQGGTILDVGCGNGASCLALRDCCKATVYGIDLSKAMIADARSRIRDSRIHLFVGDGETLDTLTETLRVDAVMYNAALFVFPDPLTAFTRARAFLKPGGVLGFSFYPRVYTTGIDDLIGWAFRKREWPLPRFRTITTWSKACQTLQSVFETIDTQTYEMEGSIDFLIDFFTIPAQSASLFPKLTYPERIPKIKKLFESLSGLEHPFTIGWDMAKATYRGES